MTQSKTLYFKNLPDVKRIQKLSRAKNIVLIYDEKLKTNTEFKYWSSAFTHLYAVSAGEKLKDIDQFSVHVKSVMPMLSGFSPQESLILAVGGGSVGDMVGFLASVLKRGIGLVHMPSTWLAAMDSSHGGKTALNVDEYKNQVGTFYPAQFVICVEELLTSQPIGNLNSAFGEVVKMALLDKKVYAKIKVAREFSPQLMWKVLPDLVKAKYRIVARDPKEQKGIRHLLNLGHTLGHVIEVENKIAHGQAVLSGVQFATDWSFRRKILSQKQYDELKSLYLKNASPKSAPLDASRLHLRLRQDKKSINGDKIRFVFVAGPGRPIIREEKIEDIVKAAYELGWAK